MAIDETIPRPKSSNASPRRSAMTEQEKKAPNPTASARSGYLLARKHRIERWAYRGRSLSVNDTATTASASLGTFSAQKRSESTYSQAGRVLNIHLLQMSEQRQKVIEQNNFEQKLFANKQALKHKDNPNVLRTLNYVRKCCKYGERTYNEKEKIDPAIFLEETNVAKRSRSRSPTATSPAGKHVSLANVRIQTSASMAETFLRHNRKHLDSSPVNRRLTSSKSTSNTPTGTNASATPVDDDSQKRHVQFHINTNGKQFNSQSAHTISKSHPGNGDKQIIRQVASANGVRSSSSSHDARPANSAPLLRTILSTLDPSHEQLKLISKPKRSLSCISSAKNVMQEFRLHPERFLSASNRYLPLLRRQALEAESKERFTKQRREKSDIIRKARRSISPPLSRLSNGSDMTYEDAKSFLSEENDIEKPIEAPAWLEQARKTNKKFRVASKLSLMDSIDAEDTSEHQTAMARLRDREYAHLQDLIRSNPIEKILEPFSAIKTDEENPIDPEQQKLLDYKRLSIPSNTDQSSLKPSRGRRLSDILHSIDSLRCTDMKDRRARRQVAIERNRAKLEQSIQVLERLKDGNASDNVQHRQ